MPEIINFQEIKLKKYLHLASKFDYQKAIRMPDGKKNVFIKY